MKMYNSLNVIYVCFPAIWLIKTPWFNATLPFGNGHEVSESKGKDLYAFWGNIITQSVQQALDEQGDRILINLASDEYYKSVKESQLEAQIVKPVFLDNKNG